ncbi:hypothetical protein RJT34_11032 [Clitoria ternatea]|uniref:Protein JASON n=1 Tax=Clitoria ternatea TaxID=43366 RepID=A0AAN9JJ67_CLITE
MLKRVLGFLLRFFFRSFAKLMGCFLACLRIRDLRRIHTSHSNSTDVLISGNRLSSSLSEEDGEYSGTNGMENQEYEKGLKDEAKFLKACGTIAGTPVEIRKASEKLKLSTSSDKDADISTFHSWLPHTSVEKLQLDVQQFDPPTPVKLTHEWGNGTDSFEHTPSSCISNEQDTQDVSIDRTEGSGSRNLHDADWSERKALSPWLPTDTQRKNKSVRFECDADLESYRSSSDDGHKPPNNQTAFKSSPYPTPLKLFDEMQTPGTVYPASLDELHSGKGEVRSQFVYPTFNPAENVFWCKIVEENDFNPEEDTGDVCDLVDATPNPDRGLKKNLNENEDIHFSPKWWDGNGIPNTTTKYKEDQRVKWHATPFEERLDKALSEGSLISQRKFVRGKPVAFDEIEESVTASS